MEIGSYMYFHNPHSLKIIKKVSFYNIAIEPYFPHFGSFLVQKLRKFLVNETFRHIFKHCVSTPLKERLLVFLKKTLRCLRFWHQRNWWVTLCWAHTSSHELQRAEGKRFEPCLRPSWVQLLYSQHQCRAAAAEGSLPPRRTRGW